MEFKNPFKGIFSQAKGKMSPAETRTFIRIFGDNGVRFAEVQDRNVSRLELPEDTHHFKFFDRKMKKGEEPDARTLFDRALNVSPTHFVVDRVISMREFQSLPAEKKAQLTTSVNYESSPTTSVAIAGSEARFLTADNHVVAIDRKTMRQLWPPVEEGPKSQLRNSPRR